MTRLWDTDSRGKVSRHFPASGVVWGEGVLAEGKVKDLAGSAAMKIDGSNAVEAGKALASMDVKRSCFVGGAPAAQLMLAMGAAGASPSFYGMSIDGDQAARARGMATSQVVPSNLISPREPSTTVEAPPVGPRPGGGRNVLADAREVGVGEHQPEMAEDAGLRRA